VAHLLLLTNTLAPSAEVLPSLALLSHRVHILPAEPAALVDSPIADVVLVDARRELAAGRSLCRMLRATGLSVPLLAILTEGGLAGLTAEWGVDDVLLESAGPAEVEARLRLAIGSLALSGEEDPAGGQITAGDLVIDETSYSARISGRVLDEDGNPVTGALIEVWQANAAGRYAHRSDQHPAPLDPNFSGAGRCLTDAEGGYRFITIKPGAYPWRNHHNAWRPQHVHFSLFGRAFTQRLVTQMYFPGDPLFAQDPIFNSVPDPKARERMIARFELSLTEPDWALGFEWDIVLRGPSATVFETQEDA